MPKPIKYGAYDGCATRFSSDTGEIWTCFDGVWREIISRRSKILCYEIAVLTEHEYHRNFGHHHLPPLPDAAFRSGWHSPLV